MAEFFAPKKTGAEAEQTWEAIVKEVFFSGNGRVQGLGIFRPGGASSVWKP